MAMLRALDGLLGGADEQQPKTLEERFEDLVTRVTLLERENRELRQLRREDHHALAAINSRLRAAAADFSSLPRLSS